VNTRCRTFDGTHWRSLKAHQTPQQLKGKVERRRRMGKPGKELNIGSEGAGKEKKKNRKRRRWNNEVRGNE